MSGRKYYCYCDSNCKFETMTKEQILAAIAQAAAGGEQVVLVDSETGAKYGLYVSNGKLMMQDNASGTAGGGLVFDEDAAFITKVKEKNAGGMVTFWVGTTQQYNALQEIDPYCVYIKTDDKTISNIHQAIEDAYNLADDALTVAQDANDKSTSAQSKAKSAVDTAEDAQAVAEKAKDVAEEAKAVANNHTHHYSYGMVKVHTSGEVESTTVRIPNLPSKFFIVTVGKKTGGSPFVYNTCQSFIVDNSVITNLNTDSASLLYRVTTEWGTRTINVTYSGSEIEFTILSNTDQEKIYIMHISAYS